MSLLRKYCETYRGLLLFAAYFYVIGTLLSFIRVAILFVIYAHCYTVNDNVYEIN